MQSKASLTLGVAAIAVMAGAPVPVAAQQDPAIRINASDLGGVVSGPNGPEAGVWVIAETTDLPTKMAKMVVTDDQGRYVLPDLPGQIRRSGCAATGWWIRPRSRHAREGCSISPRCRRRMRRPPPNTIRSIYWYAMIKIPEKSEFPGTGPSGNGINPAMKNQGEFMDGIQDRWLRRLPPARQQGDAHDVAAARQVQFRLRGLGPPHPVGPGRRQHGRQHRPHGHAAHAADDGRLDRPHRRRRVAGEQAGAAARRRAQCRHHGLGLGQPEGLYA